MDKSREQNGCGCPRDEGCDCGSEEKDHVGISGVGKPEPVVVRLAPLDMRGDS